MQTKKVIYLEEFRKKRQPVLNMKAVIESHLAEAGIHRLSDGEIWHCLDGNQKCLPQQYEGEGTGLIICEPGHGE